MSAARFIEIDGRRYPGATSSGFAGSSGRRMPKRASLPSSL
jgi:hypothetical protein